MQEKGRNKFTHHSQIICELWSLLTCHIPVNDARLTKKTPPTKGNLTHFQRAFRIPAFLSEISNPAISGTHHPAGVQWKLTRINDPASSKWHFDHPNGSHIFTPCFRSRIKISTKKTPRPFEKNRSQRKINHPKIFRSEDPGTWICFPRILPRNCSTSSANWVVLNPRADKLIMASGGVKIRNKLIY